MAETTLQLDAGERAALRLALINQILCETERVDEALVQHDRDRHVKAARSSVCQICRLSRLLDRIGWKAKNGSVSVKIDPDRELTLMVCALRDCQCCVYDAVRDAHTYEDANAVRIATAQLDDATRLLLRLEGLAGKLGRDLGQWPAALKC